MKKAGSILSEVIRDHPLGKLKALGRLRSSWNEVVGETISAHAVPVDLREGTLVVEVDTSVWMQQLSFLKSQMVEKFRAQDVRDIRFVLARSSRGTLKGTSGRRAWNSVPLQPQDEALIQSCEESLADPELKKHIARLLHVALSRRKGS